MRRTLLCRLAVPIAIIGLSACDTERVTAEAGRSCGPLEEPAFVIDVPVEGGIIEAQANGPAEQAGGIYTIGQDGNYPSVGMYFCTTVDSPHCQRAESGTFEVTRDGDRWRGELQAQFPQAGHITQNFMTQDVTDLEEVLCG